MSEPSRSYLVTGGAGFIGSNLVLALQEKFPHARLTVIDDFRSGDFKNLRGYQGDFVAHYIMPVLYPDGLTDRMQIVLGVGVFVINLTLYAIAFRRRQVAPHEPVADARIA